MVEALPYVWFILIAVLWTGYLVFEGFDFGVGMLLKVLPKGSDPEKDKDRRIMLSSIGPHWDGNEVWLITAGGAMFAAFPEWYATMFSGMYLALFLILVVLIVRICAIEWRGKISDVSWRRRWDTGHAISAWAAAILWGVAFSNLVQGMDIELDAAGNSQMVGGLLSLLTPFTLLGGVMMAAVFGSHGLMFLALKTAGPIHDRAKAAAKVWSVVATLLAAVWALWAQLSFSPSAVSWIPLVIAASGFVVATAAAQAEREGLAFAASAVGITGAVSLIFTIMFPNVMVSSTDPGATLSIVDAAATGPTLIIMSIIAVVLVPIVLGYQVWTYVVFARRLRADVIPDTPAGLSAVEKPVPTLASRQPARDDDMKDHTSG